MGDNSNNTNTTTTNDSNNNIFTGIDYVAVISCKGDEERLSGFFKDFVTITQFPLENLHVHKFERGQVQSSKPLSIIFSHQSVVREALKVNAKNILVFEDDSRFYDGNDTNAHDLIRKRLKTNIDWIVNNPKKWNMFFLGCIHRLFSIPTQFIKANDKGNYCSINYTPFVALAHAYVLNRQVMEKLDKHIPPYFMPSFDMTFLNSVGKKYSAYPQLCYQCEQPKALNDISTRFIPHVSKLQIWSDYGVLYILFCLFLIYFFFSSSSS